MSSSVVSRLCALLGQAGDPWPDALAYLCTRVGGEVAIALLVTGGISRRLGSLGPIPPSACQATDETVLHSTLSTIGMTGVWTYAFFHGPEKLAIVAVARRGAPFAPDELEVLDEATLAMALAVEAAAARVIAAAEADTRRRAEQKVVELDRMSTIGNVAAAVAHDLAAPISAMMMELGVMRERVDEVIEHVPQPGPILRNLIDDMRGLVDSCNEAADRARGLLIDFRLAAHPRSEGTGPESQKVQIGDALRACVRMVLPLARERARIELTIEPDLPIIPGSRRRLEQAFTNLLVNAIHAASIREAYLGKVEARARRDGSDVVVEISDNGAGMPDDVKARIFEPFFTTKALGVGTGLGLPIARDAVESHGGRLEVESERGRGALFRVRLPVEKLPAIASPLAGRKSVLVVDDDELVRRSLERILRAEYDVSLARSGLEALDYLDRGKRFDAMIVDLAMPGMGGADFFSNVQRRWPGLEHKMIFATGGAFTPMSREFLEKVPNSRFEKPISREELRPILERVVQAA